ncbi:MAG: hypothetical protein P9M14_13940 [Candidatus Alcyoniella australis]|nr:hypothetical protein [Candidatus Alcyoniella australis]
MRRIALVALFCLLLACNVGLLLAYSALDLSAEQAMAQSIEGPRDTTLVWEFVGLTPGADIFDRSQPLVQSLVRYALIKNQAQLLTDMGLAYLDNPEYENQAEDFLRDAVNKSEQMGIVPTCPHHGLGTIFFAQGQTESALKQWETFIGNSESVGIEDDNTYLIRWSLSVVHFIEGNDQQSLLYVQSFIPLARNDQDRALAHALRAALRLRAQTMRGDE